ncbi:hypothetical protein [Parachlamydia sp. AcF125]|uniref:hypothetical protein n=1 Tax=Parachlamydia sp. AcF125 TaxID=2795736 RepID=UPI001BC93B71|nr:hypothetical protein [Parachlamydia sp. AcF125]MBS4169096.1 hypothetical protein [Parachlamydia sp. AcF125]
MYGKEDKRRIYALIDLYLSGNIDEPKFCEEFHSSYNLELDYDSLTDEEQEAFASLGEVTGRFSEFAEDHLKYPGIYYTKEELRRQISETRKKLGRGPIE